LISSLFLFFVARDFIAAIYDEVKNKSVTKRLKSVNSRKSAQLYDDMNIKKVDENVY